MAKFRHMASMERTQEEKDASRLSDYVMPDRDGPDVPYGLCICLTERELAKLDLPHDCEVGDYIHLFCMAKVTSVSSSDYGNGPTCNVSLAIVAMEAEDEDDEDVDGGER